MIKIGLTGSIGMGKSTTGQMFVELGCPLHDADASVHRLYKGKAAPLIEATFPGTTNQDGVNRHALAKVVLNDDAAMKKLESIIHPLVHEEEQTFFERAVKDGAECVVLDIPLLFETNATARCDVIVVVSAPEDIQRERVLARPGMSVEKFEAIKARQMPDAEKRKRADYVIETGNGMIEAKEQVARIVEELKHNKKD
ncbi:dephospho-CoA kinase [Cohaesibacter gelatinilyticus]|uniref:Dephospho-CoA kinase n=1 Tax=Cohaesibacter gelatinilyticus TaxID=372072 RepID=A0A285PDU5_9HYPH|nr:dephospho-CoA kinase [Cohaesibacter gelatinilyticus]SNZ19895.1 dephospho-CoA kinase [Cohaesibacter gelatinilyticus]HAT87022.1 dephospho-CoA kinase [Hyphomicrobiales bacterium]